MHLYCIIWIKNYFILYKKTPNGFEDLYHVKKLHVIN